MACCFPALLRHLPALSVLSVLCALCALSRPFAFLASICSSSFSFGPQRTSPLDNLAPFHTSLSSRSFDSTSLLYLQPHSPVYFCYGTRRPPRLISTCTASGWAGIVLRSSSNPALFATTSSHQLGTAALHQLDDRCLSSSNNCYRMKLTHAYRIHSRSAFKYATIRNLLSAS